MFFANPKQEINTYVCGIDQHSHAGLLVSRIDCSGPSDKFVTEEYRLKNGQLIYRHTHGIDRVQTWTDRHNNQIEEPVLWPLSKFEAEFGDTSNLHTNLESWCYGI